MRTLAFLIAVLSAGIAYANYTCGYPPYPPYGCKYVCVCDKDKQNCDWVLICK